MLPPRSVCDLNRLRRHRATAGSPQVACYVITLQNAQITNPREVTLLIDWERAGPGQEFEIRVHDVTEAKSFYGIVLGAQETSRHETAEGDPVRLGLAIGRVQFTISSDSGEDADRPLLSVLAADLGVPFVAIILHVENPDIIAYQAEKNGAKVSTPPDAAGLIVFTDPFGSHWVLIKREAALSPLSGQPRNVNTLH